MMTSNIHKIKEQVTTSLLKKLNYFFFKNSNYFYITIYAIINIFILETPRSHTSYYIVLLVLVKRTRKEVDEQEERRKVRGPRLLIILRTIIKGVLIISHRTSGRCSFRSCFITSRLPRSCRV